MTHANTLGDLAQRQAGRGQRSQLVIGGAALRPTLTRMCRDSDRVPNSHVTRRKQVRAAHAGSNPLEPASSTERICDAVRDRYASRSLSSCRAPACGTALSASRAPSRLARPADIAERILTLAPWGRRATGPGGETMTRMGRAV